MANVYALLIARTLLMPVVTTAAEVPAVLAPTVRPAIPTKTEQVSACQMFPAMAPQYQPCQDAEENHATAKIVSVVYIAIRHTAAQMPGTRHA